MLPENQGGIFIENYFKHFQGFTRMVRVFEKNVCSITIDAYICIPKREEW